MTKASHPAGSRFWRIGRRGAAARLRRDQNGSTAIEFAIIAPVFFFLMFVIAETALVFIAEQVMDNAVFDTARLVRTGQVQNAGMTEEDFQEEICGRMSVFVDCSSSAFYLDVKSYDTFAEMEAELTIPLVDEEGEFIAAGEFEFGGESEIVVVRAYYQWRTRNIISPTLNGTLSMQGGGMSGKRLIGSFAAFRNEPFGETE